MPTIYDSWKAAWAAARTDFVNPGTFASASAPRGEAVTSGATEDLGKPTALAACGTNFLI